MTATCCWPNGCPNKSKAQNYCNPHYTKLRAAGKLVTGYVDPGPVRAHIEAHLARGENLADLATRAGLTRTGLSNIRRCCNKAVRVGAAQRILAVPLPPTYIGTVRRLQALARLGHLRYDIAAAAGLTWHSMKAASSPGRCHARLRIGIRVAYEQLSGSPGTSQFLIKRAQRAAWPSPLAWHGVDMDDPAAVPDLGPVTRVTAADKVAEIEHLTSLGVPQAVACKQVGIKPETLHSIRWRAAQRLDGAA
jgi:hypothetical protein